MDNNYGFSVSVGRDFDHTVEAVTGALKKQGFGIVSDIDMQAIFKEKLAVDDRPYRILGVCNPMISHQALRADADIGLLLPCNVVVRQDRDGRVVVSFTSPEALLGITGNDDLIVLGMEVRRRLERARDGIAADLDAKPA